MKRRHSIDDEYTVHLVLVSRRFRDDGGSSAINGQRRGPSQGKSRGRSRMWRMTKSPDFRAGSGWVMVSSGYISIAFLRLKEVMVVMKD
uniref:Uncharacterized protein n=1 Tax=Pyxicephalus adspersus TaxID=30357 RepID=A0AAV2ZDS3_PYXAD|nr:TPA: hypothetical protein GDO54_004852 [Pyxicephalus adspersus]